jgi:hypothetical protein
MISQAIIDAPDLGSDLRARRRNGFDPKVEVRWALSLVAPAVDLTK